jgi:hypothetical protein
MRHAGLDSLDAKASQTANDGGSKFPQLAAGDAHEAWS